MREQRRIHRRHAGRRGAAGFGALDQAEPFLQHRQRRIGEARILVVIDRAGERGLGLLGVVVDIARGEDTAPRRSRRTELRCTPPCTRRVAVRYLVGSVVIVWAL